MGLWIIWIKYLKQQKIVDDGINRCVLYPFVFKLTTSFDDDGDDEIEKHKRNITVCVCEDEILLIEHLHTHLSCLSFFSDSIETNTHTSVH